MPGEPVTLVDVGAATTACAHALDRGLRAAGYTARDVRQVVITRTHPDHSGLAGRLQKSSGATVFVHPAGREDISSPTHAWERRLHHLRRVARAAHVPPATLRAYLDAVATTPPAADDPDEGALVALADGAVIRAAGVTWRVLHTPGPAAEHIGLLHAASGSLVGGDLLLRYVQTHPSLATARPPDHQPGPLTMLVRSWRNAARQPLSIVWPGHGPPIRAHKVLIARRMAELRSRLVAARSAVDAGAETIWDVVIGLGGPEAPARLDAVLGESVALMDWLAARGHVERAARQGVVYYSPGRPLPE